MASGGLAGVGVRALRKALAGDADMVAAEVAWLDDGHRTHVRVYRGGSAAVKPI